MNLNNKFTIDYFNQIIIDEIIPLIIEDKSIDAKLDFLIFNSKCIPKLKKSDQTNQSLNKNGQTNKSLNENDKINHPSNKNGQINQTLIVNEKKEKKKKKNDKKQYYLPDSVFYPLFPKEDDKDNAIKLKRVFGNNLPLYSRRKSYLLYEDYYDNFIKLIIEEKKKEIEEEKKKKNKNKKKKKKIKIKKKKKKKKRKKKKKKKKKIKIKIKKTKKWKKKQ